MDSGALQVEGQKTRPARRRRRGFGRIGGGPLGFYEAAYTVEEAADLIDTAQARNLKDELSVTRVAVRHALLRLKQELEPAEFARLIALIFKGTHTIADIIRVQRSLPGDKDDLLSVPRSTKY